MRRWFLCKNGLLDFLLLLYLFIPKFLRLHLRLLLADHRRVLIDLDIMLLLRLDRRDLHLVELLY